VATSCSATRTDSSRLLQQMSCDSSPSIEARARTSLRGTEGQAPEVASSSILDTQADSATTESSSALGQLIEHEDECGDASSEHNESNCCDAPRDELEPSGSESPSQGDKRALAELWTNEPEPYERSRGHEPARGTKLDPPIVERSLRVRSLNIEIARLTVVGPERQGYAHRGHDRRQGVAFGRTCSRSIEISDEPLTV
jgi:hypothetical protein